MQHRACTSCLQVADDDDRFSFAPIFESGNEDNDGKVRSDIVNGSVLDSMQQACKFAKVTLSCGEDGCYQAESKHCLSVSVRPSVL